MPKQVVRHGQLPPQNQRRRGGNVVVVLEDEAKPGEAAAEAAEEVKAAQAEKLDSESVPPSGEALSEGAVAGVFSSALPDSDEMPTKSSSLDAAQPPKLAQVTEAEAIARVAASHEANDELNALPWPQIFCMRCGT